ncbi:MAG: D-aminoacyl-tRNA deacylase [Allobranchiibius sp.]
MSRAHRKSGIFALIVVTQQDSQIQADHLAAQIAHLRLTVGEKSVSDPGAPVPVVSQFTLSGDTRRGRRPSWSVSARSRPAAHAEPLIQRVDDNLRGMGLAVATGRFGTDLQIAMTADGPSAMLVNG